MSGKSKKLKLGFFSFTCCEGCVTVFSTLLPDYYDGWKEKIDITDCKLLRSHPSYKTLDIAFVEGAIATNAEVKQLKEIRNKSKILIALGSGAITGQPSSSRNFFSAALKKKIGPRTKLQREKIQPISDFVEVDDQVPGCPIIADQFIKVLNKYLTNYIKLDINIVAKNIKNLTNKTKKPKN